MTTRITIDMIKEHGTTDHGIEFLKQAALSRYFTFGDFLADTPDSLAIVKKIDDIALNAIISFAETIDSVIDQFPTKSIKVRSWAKLAKQASRHEIACTSICISSPIYQISHLYALFNAHNHRNLYIKQNLNNVEVSLTKIP